MFPSQLGDWNSEAVDPIGFSLKGLCQIQSKMARFFFKKIFCQPTEMLNHPILTKEELLFMQSPLNHISSHLVKPACLAICFLNFYSTKYYHFTFINQIGFIETVSNYNSLEEQDTAVKRLMSERLLSPEQKIPQIWTCRQWMYKMSCAVLSTPVKATVHKSCSLVSIDEKIACKHTLIHFVMTSPSYLLKQCEVLKF